MTSSVFSKIAILVVVAGFAAGCANTIRGVGQDAASTVRATQDAGRTVERAAN